MKTACLFLVGLLILGLALAESEISEPDMESLEAEYSEAFAKRGCNAIGSWCTVNNNCCPGDGKNRGTCSWGFHCV
ncbi:nemertide alpha-1-like [Lineus longissimus]|uniref:nemertide alpha-1-like n=1 Tax=Lineus longissimus TaxID=88925 RepID=UPI002B4E3DEE